MILTLDQIKNILVNNPAKDFLSACRKYHKELRSHLYGESLKECLPIIEGFEKPTLRELRVKYAKSNKDLFSRLGRPIDKVFNARGGSVYYNLNESQDKRARELSLNIRDGYSIKKWVEMFWKPHFLDDPNGFVFMELAPLPVAKQLQQAGRSFVYPTYKSISCVFDYLPKGSSLEYVVFKVENRDKKAAGYQEGDQIFRVFDDAFDYWVKLDGENVSVLTDHTYPNYFGEVPAILNSDVASPQTDGMMLSLYDDVIELANHFLLKGSIKVTHEFMHGFPKYWEYADSCDSCAGTGYKEANECPSCKGTGKRTLTKVSDVKLLQYPDKDNPAVAPDVAGYVSPDKTYYEISVNDLEALESTMNFTIWGTGSKKKTEGMSVGAGGEMKTATEVMDDTQPMSDRLGVISDMAERRHKFILDNIIRMNFSLFKFTGSSVNYGKRFLLETPDVIWAKYSAARTAGSSYAVLDDLLTEYFEAKYATDPVKLAIALKLKDVEPFTHNSVDEIKEWPIASFDRLKKAYFGQWLADKTEGELLIYDVDYLIADLGTFVVDLSKADEGKNDNTPLAVKLGVGGTQSLQLILTDPILGPEAKKNMLIILFGVKQEDATKLVAGMKDPTDEKKPLPGEEEKKPGFPLPA